MVPRSRSLEARELGPTKETLLMTSLRRARRSVRAGKARSPRRDAYRVPFLEVDDLVVNLHAAMATCDEVDFFLGLVHVTVWKAIAGRDALVGQA